jgi:hypothetical protein
MSRYIAEQPNPAVLALPEGFAIQMKRPGDTKGEIMFPGDPVPKKWSVTFQEMSLDYLQVYGIILRSRIHVEHKDWRKRKDAPEIRRAIINATRWGGEVKAPKGVVFADPTTIAPDAPGPLPFFPMVNPNWMVGIAQGNELPF